MTLPQVMAQIPAGVGPGQQFIVHLGEQRLMVTAPDGCQPGQRIRLAGNPVVGVSYDRRRLMMATTRNARAGLIFPIGRIERYLRGVNKAPRLGTGAPVYLAAVLEYLR